MINKKDKQKWNVPGSFILIIFLILSVSIVFAEGENFSMYDTLRNSQWEYLTILALFGAFAIVAITFMISKAFGLPELEAWSRNEFYQASAMVVIVFVIFVMVNIENRVFESFGYSGSINEENSVFESSKEYLSSIRVYFGTLFLTTYIANTASVTLLQSADISNIPVIGAYISAYVNYKNSFSHLADVIQSLLGMISGVLGFGFGISYMQRFFLDFIKDTAFTIMLPLGIFLRSLPFGRSVGSILIALAIAFFLVYPLTFLMDQKIVDHILIQSAKERGQILDCQKDCWKDLIKNRALGLKNKLLGGLIDTAQKREDRLEFSTGILKVGAIGIATGLAAKLGLGLLATPIFIAAIYVLTEEAAFAFVTFTLLAIFNVIITLSTARGIAQILGSDVSFGDLIQVL